ncbi:MAG TPA: hypothetical protein IAC03_07800 [Candidatus Coprenecus pullistercoris]|nr:hypothetical protein [Candidatus Coprenecus pullistercoris]
MDWLGIIVAVLVFVLPPLLENRRKRHVEHHDEAQDPVWEEYRDEMRSPEPVEVERLSGKEEVRSAEEPSALRPEARMEAAPSVSDTSHIQDAAPRAKRRFNARDMVIYSEILHPKYLEKRENL